MVTGLRKGDVGRSKSGDPEGLFEKYQQGRVETLERLRSVLPTVVDFRSTRVDYSRCLDFKCGLHHICEACWFNTLAMPAVKSLCGDGWTPKKPVGNLYVATFTGITGYPAFDANLAACRVRHAREFFQHVVQRPLFRKGGLITGMMGYYYLYRFPHHRRLDELVRDRRGQVCSDYSDLGWSPKVVLLFRSPVRIPSRVMRYFMTNSMSWWRHFTDEELKVPENKRLDLHQRTYLFRPPAEAYPHDIEFMVKAIRMGSAEEAIVRYATGRPLGRNVRKLATTSFGTTLRRDLRLPLLECEPGEAALLLDELYRPEPGKTRVQHQAWAGDFLSTTRPLSTWAKVMGPFRSQRRLKQLLTHLKLDRPPDTPEQDEQFRRALGRLKGGEVLSLVSAFLHCSTASEWPTDKRHEDWNV